MSRKHYRMIARIIRDNEVGIVGTNDLYLRKDNIINDLILMFEDDNFLFDRDKFIKDCEYVNKYIINSCQDFASRH